MADFVSGGAGAEPPRERGGFLGRAPRATNQPSHVTPPARAIGPALEGCYQLLLQLIPRLSKFPRDQKFLLGDRLQTQAMEVLDQLIVATYSRERQASLRAANLGLERLRFGVRLAKDLRCFDLKAYEHMARQLDEVGRMVGGWIKADREASHGAA